jgi:hypothetical protein
LRGFTFTVEMSKQMILLTCGNRSLFEIF